VATSLAQSDLFCMTSLCAESYGMVTAQALEIGTPVLGSDIGATPELLRHNITGLILPPGDKTAWKAALSTFIKDRAALKQLRDTTAQYRHEFSAKHIAEAYEAFIATT